jgi:hypothetical protein
VPNAFSTPEEVARYLGPLAGFFPGLAGQHFVSYCQATPETRIIIYKVAGIHIVYWAELEILFTSANMSSRTSNFSIFLPLWHIAEPASTLQTAYFVPMAMATASATHGAAVPRHMDRSVRLHGRHPRRFENTASTLALLYDHEADLTFGQPNR